MKKIYDLCKLCEEPDRARELFDERLKGDPSNFETRCFLSGVFKDIGGKINLSNFEILLQNVSNPIYDSSESPEDVDFLEGRIVKNGSKWKYSKTKCPSNF